MSKYCDNIHIVEVDLEEDGYAIKKALYELTGQSTFPNLFNHSQTLGGYDRLSALDREGKLANLCDVSV